MVESHNLLLSIYRNSPALLLNIVPLLEENLRAADEVTIRQLSTKTLGTMFGERVVVGTGVADIAKAYPNAWKAWLSRKLDKALVVRLAWVNAAKGILVNHSELRKDLEGELVFRWIQARTHIAQSSFLIGRKMLTSASELSSAKSLVR
jgi:sister-chromatid-cohesion protein PDS5